jgi:hypothetical protein
LGDAEFYLVFRKVDAATEIAVSSAAEHIERYLLSLGLAGKIGLSAVDKRYLAGMPRHILTYELRSCGRVIWGDTDVLSVVPSFSPSEISREDAWRLLANRIVEQLGTISSTGRSDSSEVQYATVKLYLDMATSYLVFVGHYGPTYRGRERALRELASGAGAESPPFWLRVLVDRVGDCTRFKLDGAPLTEAWYRQEDRFEPVRVLWKWELAQLTGEPEDCSEAQLMSRWMECQALRAKLRGWVSVVRRCGVEGWTEWPRWLRIAGTASPRYWIYSVASELLFHSERRAELEEATLALAEKLPFRGPRPNGKGVREWLISLTAANYHRFLETTTS